MLLAELNQTKVTRAFNRTANHYEKAAILQREIAGRMLARLDLIKFQPRTIIDIGAGTGHASRLLAKRFPKARIISLDIAFNMVHAAKRHKSWFSKQQILCADTLALPLKTDSVDFIFSNLCLHWTPNLVGALQEWQRVLRPEGLLLFSTYGPDTLKELRQCWASVDEYAHVHPFFDMHDIGDALLRQKFIEPVLDVDCLTLTYANVMQLMRELKAFGSQNCHQQRASGLIGKGKMAKMQATYNQLRNAEQKIPATFEVVFGHAWGSSNAQKNQLGQINATKHEISIPVDQIFRS